MANFKNENQLEADYHASFLAEKFDEQMAYDIECCFHAIMRMGGENVLKKGAVHIYQMGLLAGKKLATETN